MSNTLGLIIGGRKELMREDMKEQFGKDRKETDRISKRAIEAEVKVDNDKGMNLIVYPLIKHSLSAYRQHRRIWSVGRTGRSHVGGSPNDWLL